MCNGQRLPLPKEREGNYLSALDYNKEWLDPTLSAEELRARFTARFPNASADPMVTGCFFPGLVQCRPCPFALGEDPELGMSSSTTRSSGGTFSLARTLSAAHAPIRSSSALRCWRRGKGFMRC